VAQVGPEGPPAGWRLEASPFYRILEYSEGGGMVRHSDGNNAHPSRPDVRTQFTMLVYLSTCADGGGATSLFRTKKAKQGRKPPQEGADTSGDSDDLIESVAPVRNSALLFPHAWPHTGCEVRGSKKIALRAELYLVEDTARPLSSPAGLE